MTNIGFELGLFGMIDLQADYFTEYRSNILMDRAQTPSTLGLQGSYQSKCWRGLLKRI
jgi:hypothetical protein